jgi:hypothetical protein
MPIVAELPPMTQQYKPYAKAAIEHVSVFDSFHNVTMRNNEYMQFIILHPLLIQNALKKEPAIEKRVNDATFISNWDITNQENSLSPSEVNSMSLLNGSYKKEILRLKNKVSESSGHIFSQVSRKLYKLPFQNCAVEINSDESMKFTLSFANDRLLMVTKYNKPEEMNIGKDQIMYSFFINRKLIASDVANLEVFTKNFKGYISI